MSPKRNVATPTATALISNGNTPSAIISLPRDDRKSQYDKDNTEQNARGKKRKVQIFRYPTMPSLLTKLYTADIPRLSNISTNRDVNYNVVRKHIELAACPMCGTNDLTLLNLNTDADRKLIIPEEGCVNVVNCKVDNCMADIDVDLLPACFLAGRGVIFDTYGQYTPRTETLATPILNAAHKSTENLNTLKNKIDHLSKLMNQHPSNDFPRLNAPTTPATLQHPKAAGVTQDDSDLQLFTN